MSSIKRNKKLVLKLVEHKVEETCSDGLRGVQLGRLALSLTQFYTNKVDSSLLRSALVRQCTKSG